MQVMKTYGNVQGDAGTPSRTHKSSSQLQLKMREINTGKCIHIAHETQPNKKLAHNQQQ